jgi:hypothetical protein
VTGIDENSQIGRGGLIFMFKVLKIEKIFKNELGVTLVAAAVIAFFVALVALTTLALTKAQIETVDDQTNVQQAKLVSEIGLETATLGIRNGIAESTPDEVEGLQDMSPQELRDFLRDPESNRGVVYGEDPERTFYSAMESRSVSSAESSDFKTISGNSQQSIITYVDNTTVVRDITEYDYKDLTNEQENWIYSLGESRKSESDARTSLSAKVFDQNNTLFERREVKTQGFNENHPNPPYIESEHSSYGMNINRSWVVSYPSDPVHPNRRVQGINLVFEPNDIGLGSAGDTLSFSAWNGSSFEPFFAAMSGPIYEGTFKYVTATPFPTNTIKINFKTDTIDESTNYNADYGFRVSGIKYNYDSDIIPALYETPHPYDELESNGSALLHPQFTQIIYSPYALPGNLVNPIKDPGDDIITPIGTPWETGSSGSLGGSGKIGGNDFQVMRIRFDENFSLETGDHLDIYNANNGSLMHKYSGTSGAGAYSPYAYRTNPDFPLAIALVFVRDGDNSGSTNNYGFRVDLLEYSDQNGKIVSVEYPTVKTAFGSNMGYNDGLAGQMQDNFIFKPADPVEGGSVTGWKIIFGNDVNLVEALGDDDVIIVKKYSILSPLIEWRFVAKTNIKYGLPGYYDIDQLRGRKIDMGTNDWLEVISEFDNKNSFWGSKTDQGWSIARIEVSYDNAIATDLTKPKLRSSAITTREVSGAVATVDNMVYPSFGADVDSIGEWWITSKDKSQILVHFDLDSFRLEQNDEIQIYNDGGQLVKTIRTDVSNGNGHGGPIDFGDPNNGGPIDFDLLPNPPAELIDTFGWVIIPSESVRILLVGDGGSNVGYTGFDIDRVAFWSPTVAVRNELGDFSTKDTSDYASRQSKPPKQFIQY